MGQNSKSGGGSKKKERNRVKCARYAASRKQQRSKEKRIKAHIKAHPNDLGAPKALSAIKW